MSSPGKVLPPRANHLDAWWVLWVAVLMVVAEAAAGIDLYAHQPAWILGNIVFGLVALVDDLTGTSLCRVPRDLEEIDAFGSRP